jgi:beta-N-acetylhexosaminidase
MGGFAMPTTELARRAAGQLVTVGVPGPALDARTRAFLGAYAPGGVILFWRNVGDARRLRRLVADLKTVGSGVPPIVSIDHEGGRVHRLGPPFTHFPAAEVVGRHGPAVVRAVGEAMGRELASVGIDLDFAPVLDVATNARNRVIGDRAFSATPAAAARLALALAAGLRRGGVIPCGKHFPGHGGTVGDSHHVLPRDPRSRRVLEREAIAPFRAAIRAGLPALMTAHVVYPALDPRRPATLSPAILTRLLRERLGFRGALFSDDLEMQAIAGRRDPGRAALAALAAGCDMLLVCNSLEVAAAVIDRLADAIARGRLPAARVREALGRIHALRRIRRPSRLADPLRWPPHARLRRRVAGEPSRA